MREIFAADFRDRVVHHLLVGYLEPVYERMFIHDSYACRVGKGVHGGVTRLRSFLDKVTANGTIHAWYLKLDIRGFFMNIDKEILYRLVCSKTRRDSIRWLAARIIFHDCTRDYSFKGQLSLLDMIPPHKTLFKVPQGKGMPIGNLTSQFFANVYMNEFDNYVKRVLKVTHYIRYVDAILPVALQPKYGLVQTDIMPEFDYGYHPYMRKLYKKQYGIDPLQLTDPSHDSTWLWFRLHQLDYTVIELENRIRSHGLLTSSAVFPTPQMSRRMVRQDWDSWKPDYYFPMVYHNFYNEDINWIKQVTEEDRKALGKSGKLFIGLYTPALKKDNNLTKAMQAAFDGGADGVAFFNYGSLNSDAMNQIKVMAQQRGMLKK